MAIGCLRDHYLALLFGCNFICMVLFDDCFISFKLRTLIATAPRAVKIDAPSASKSAGASLQTDRASRIAYSKAAERNKSEKLTL